MTVAYRETMSDNSFKAPQIIKGQYYLSTPESFEYSQSVKPKRSRKIHAKVRTGCLTCKARRKKCDEAKPACLACTSTGRKCEGYRNLQRQDSSECPKIVAAVESDSRPLAPSYRKCLNTGEEAPSAWLTPPTTPEKTQEIDFFDTLYIDTNETNDQCITTARNFSYATHDIEGGLIAPTRTPTFLPISPVMSWIDSKTSAPLLNQNIIREPSHKLHPVVSAKYAAIPSMLITPSTHHQVTDLKRHCLSFFRYQTAPSFASYFNFGLFENQIIAAALKSPLLLACAAALGAVHRRYEYGISREAFEYCMHAKNLHEEALQKLAAYKATSIDSNGVTKAHCRDTIAFSEFILSLFESFQGEHGKTVEHINNGMKQLLERPMTLLRRESHYCAVGPSTNIFPRLFNRLAYSAHRLFDTPPQILARQNDGRILPPIPPRFGSLDEARDYILTEFYWIRNISIATWRDPSKRREVQRLHVRRISQWSVSYAETIKSMKLTPRRNRACKMMKLTKSASNFIIYSLLSTDLDVDMSLIPQQNSGGADHLTDYDQDQAYTEDMLWQIIWKREKLVAHLTSLNVLAESNLDEAHTFHYEEHSLSLDSAIGPPKSEIVPASSGKIRHMVKYLGSEQTPDDELWSAMGVYGIAEKWNGVEEHAVINGIKAIIPETVNPKWVNISWMMESRKVLLRYCRPDELGLEWVHEWWTF